MNYKNRKMLLNTKNKKSKSKHDDIVLRLRALGEQYNCDIDSLHKQHKSRLIPLYIIILFLSISYIILITDKFL